MHKKGFTLIELLVVMAIIGILAGMIFTVGRAARQRAMIFEANSMIASLETAVSMYYADEGSYPPEDPGGTGSCINLYTALSSGGTNPPYIELEDEQIGAAGSVIDPWGNPFHYDLSPASGNTASYNLWSLGPDGTNGTADDITNW